MQLGQTEAFRVFNQNNCGVRDIDADFNDRCRHQHLDLVPSKSRHQFFLLLIFHLPVQIFHTDLIRKDLLQALAVINDIFPFRGFTFFHHRTDDIGLMPQLHLLPNEGISLFAVIDVHHRIFNGQAVFGHFVHHGYVQIAV